jgi:ABC-2 type transport system permease protein
MTQTLQPTATGAAARPAAPVAATRPRVLLPAASLWKREMVRFYRQPNRVASALVQPMIFWLFFGAGLGSSFRLPSGGAADVSYFEYFFPGAVTLIVLFTAIFSTISIIEDRREGFLQGVLAAPVLRAAIVLGKVMGGTSIALLQSALFLLLAPLLGLDLDVASGLAAAGVLVLVGFGLTALGFCFAWSLDSVQGFHAIMMVLLMPMWLLSGAFFPSDGAPGWLEAVMAVNPLTYGVASVRHAMYLTQPGRAGAIPGAELSLALTLAFAVVAFGAAFLIASRRDKGSAIGRQRAGGRR